MDQKNNCLHGVCCDVSSCAYNNHRECHANTIHVATISSADSKKHADCETYRKRDCCK